MKRRKFLTTFAAGVVGAGVTKGISADTSGPISGGCQGNLISPHLLRLSLRDSGVPQEQYAYYGALCQTAQDVFLNPTQAAVFAADPTSFFTSKGIQGVNVDTNSREYKIIAALANPQLREAAATGDAVTFANAAAKITGLDVDPNRPLLLVFFAAVIVAVFYVFVCVFFVEFWFAVDIASQARNLLLSAGLADTALLASAMNGDLFAIDVATKVAQLQIDNLINAIENGTISLPAGYTVESAVTGLREASRQLLP